MPRVKCVIKAPYSRTFRTEKIASMFDVPVTDKLEKSWDVDIPIEDFEWSVGLIVGHSGAGKTTIAKRAFGEGAYFVGNKWHASSILDDFDEKLSCSEIVEALSHVGFSSPPAWLLPYSALSNGQQFRVDLARAILETDGLLVFDEFSSVVDRTVAQVGAYAAQKFIRRKKRQFVAVTCHYDVAEWLEADWVFDVTANAFHRGRLRRPSIDIKIEQCHRSAWQIFKDHHYLDGTVARASRCFVAFVKDDPAAFCAVMPFPHPVAKNVWREHRTVTLPDYQGIGLGMLLSETVGDLLLSEGRMLVSTTSHPAMIRYRARSPKWRMTKRPSRNRKGNRGVKWNKPSNNRLTAAFRYVGNLDSCQ